MEVIDDPRPTPSGIEPRVFSVRAGGRVDDQGLVERKRRLRRAVKCRFAAFDPTVRSDETAALLREIGRLPGYAEATTLLLYIGHLAEELPTLGLLEAALERRQQVVCPRVVARDLPLCLHEVRDLRADLVAGVLGIPEPRADAPRIDPDLIDWALIPGLAFDERGRRLGRGAGHYDRLLPLLRPDVPRWAAAFSIQRVESVPTGPHDQPLTGIAWPSGPLAGGLESTDH